MTKPPSDTALAAPFEALRPALARAADVAARPYDVLSYEEASRDARTSPWNFLHVSRAEIDLPAGTPPHDQTVYAQSARAFRAMIDADVLVREPWPSYYAYRMTAGAHEQTGIAFAGSIAAYRENRIRRHEHTRPDKVEDRTLQIEAVGAHTGPILAVHRPNPVVAAALLAVCGSEPVAAAVTPDGTRHQVWRIDIPEMVNALTFAFDRMPAVWIADGHHRSAAAARVWEARQAAGLPGAERFLVISFPADEVVILDYNRIVRDLAGHNAESFLAALGLIADVERMDAPVRPERSGVFGMVLGGNWYRVSLRAPAPAGASPVERLDVSLLSDRILSPLLGIGDPRTDPRIDFVGGGRGLGALEERVRSGEWAVAFSMYPTGLAEVMAVADAGLVMPPKSTWFEPKLADGLLSLPLD